MDTTDSRTAQGEPRRPSRSLPGVPLGGHSGHAIIEFALVSMAFFMITLGTIDVGRAMYEYRQLTSAVREGVRGGKTAPPDETSIKDRVIQHAPALGLTYDDIETPVCAGGCDEGSSDVTVTAHKDFRPLLGEMFGWADDVSITLSSSATAEAA